MVVSERVRAPDPERTVFVNGDFVPESRAQVSVMDRGFLFGDGVYEVTAVIDGRLVDAVPHLDRLARSLAEVQIACPWSAAELTAIQREVARRNGIDEGTIYLQITRGAADRGFAFPERSSPTLVVFAQRRQLVGTRSIAEGIAVVTCPDLRWRRRHVKSVSLLAQVLAKQHAHAQGAGEAWMTEDGFVTEGSSSTAFIVLDDGRLVTRSLKSNVLPGITRQTVLRGAERLRLQLEERSFTLEEAKTAQEAFATGASFLVTPIVSIDGQKVGSGQPGAVAKELLACYLDLHRAG